jgi:hypothetical protein
MRSQEVQKIGFQVYRIVRGPYVVDSRSTILAGEPIGVLHPFQIDDVVQRGERHSSFRSCQFSYPLSFRGQVCESQGPLPCFPPTALSSWHPPSLGESGSPTSQVVLRCYDFPSRMLGHLFVSLPRPTLPSSVRVSRLALALLEGQRVPSGPGRCSTGDPIAGLLSRGRERDLPVPRRSVPCLCLVPGPRPNRRCLASLRFRRCCPRSLHSEGFSVMEISGLARGFSTCCLGFTRGVATTDARLASGGQARLYRKGVEPSGSLQKVSDHSHPTLLDLSAQEGPSFVSRTVMQPPCGPALLVTQDPFRTSAPRFSIPGAELAPIGPVRANYAGNPTFGICSGKYQPARISLQSPEIGTGLEALVDRAGSKNTPIGFSENARDVRMYSCFQSEKLSLCSST